MRVYFIAAMMMLLLLFPICSYAGKISKEKWLGNMKTSLPESFCKEDSYFRSCFQVSYEQCKEATLKAIDDCIAKLNNKIPSSLQKKERNTWGGKLGSCTGENYEFRFSDKKNKTEKCNEPGNLFKWIKE